MASLVVEKNPTNEPVSLDEAKGFLRVSLTDDDLLIQTLIKAAREACESFTGRSFCFKGYRQSLDAFPYFVYSMVSQQAYPPSYYSRPQYSTTLWNYSQMIKLLVAPVASVDRISFLSSSDSQWHDLVPVPNLWYPGKAYTVGALVIDNNGNVQRCTTAGTSNANPPNWSAVLNAVTTEVNPDPLAEGVGGVAWTNQGPFAAQATGASGRFGAFIADTDSEPARVFPGPPGGTWPPVLYSPNAVQLHYTAGYSADAANVPGVFKTAILQCIAGWYENREVAMLGNYQELPMHCKALLWSKRVFDLSPTRG